jgi:hypothetical protein
VGGLSGSGDHLLPHKVEGVQGYISLCFLASMTAWARLLTPSFSSTLWT